MSLNTSHLVVEMVPIPAGRFLIGSPLSEHRRGINEGPQHWVDVPAFKLSKYPITQAQWQAVAVLLPQINRELDPSPFRILNDCHPASFVSWLDAVEFCDRLSQIGHRCRLPSEAEWEYACRAGTTSAYSFGSALHPELANFGENYRSPRIWTGEYTGATPVGSFPPNAFGIYDMHGNVWELCADLVPPWGYDENSPTDGTARIWSPDLDLAVIRGGSWFTQANACRSANRSFIHIEEKMCDVGFRIAE